MSSKARHLSRQKKPGLRESLGLFCVALLLVYSAWVRGGTYPPFQLPLVVIGGLILLSMFFAGRSSAGGEGEMVRRVTMAGLWKDPVFYVGAIFLLLLLVQWLNAGRRLVFDFVAYKWKYAPPPIPWLPSAFVRSDAREMLCWFFPAWATALAMRSGLFGRRSVHRLGAIMAVSAALLGLFGLVQYLSGTRSIYWVQPLTETHFYASFGYPNHAGAYFILMLCLSSGLLIREMRMFSMERLGVVVGWALAVLLTLTGASLSLSRAAILLSWGVAGLVFLNALLCALQIPRLPTRINMVAGIMGVTFLTLFLVVGLGRGALAEELSSITRSKESANLVSGDRALALTHRAAFAIWRDNPVFGVGGWGFRYLFGMYIPADQWDRMTEGKANIHDDPLQFTVEFGAVGGLLLAISAFLLMRPALLRGTWASSLARFCMLGCLIIFLYSFVDLPFRCPAILYAWIVLLSSIPVFVSRGRSSLELTK